MDDTELVKRSDTIVVGKVLTVDSNQTPKTAQMTVARVAVLARIKGGDADTIDVVTEYDAPEEDFGSSIRPGETYVLFLIHDQAKRLRSANGPYAARPMKGFSAPSH